jgi:hypothetical protein
MRLLIRVLLAIGLLAFAACSDAKGGAQGGGSENGSYGKVRVGVPF